MVGYSLSPLPVWPIIQSYILPMYGKNKKISSYLQKNLFKTGIYNAPPVFILGSNRFFNNS